MSPRIALALFGLGIVTRLPFQAESLWGHDSVLYERAIAVFDPLAQSPQAPGYLYYVLLLRALALLTGDANRAMTVVSLVAGALAVALLYVLAARLYDERTARIGALFLLTAVTFWAYGGIAYPYTLLAALSTACALAFWRAAGTRSARDLLAASAVWALAVGFRSDLAVFLAPLWLIAAWGARLIVAIAAAITVAALVGVWYVASAVADGGIARFAQALAEQGRFVDDRYSVLGARGLGALAANGYELARYLGRGLYLVAPLLVAVPLSAAGRRIELADRRRVLFVGAWALAPLVVYLPVHVGDYGYVFSMLPGLCLVGARGAIALARGARMPRALPPVVGAVVVANAAIFLLSGSPLSAGDVLRKDRGVSERVSYLARPDLQGALLLAAYDHLVAERYAIRGDPPRHPAPAGPSAVRGYDPADPPFAFVFPTMACDRAGAADCANAPVLVVWDDLIRVHGGGWSTITLPHGATLRIARDVRGLTVRVDGLDVTLAR